ncbi:hypothetical protein ACWCO9_22490, partial [Streptomyces sp. NPDC001937]
ASATSSSSYTSPQAAQMNTAAPEPAAVVGGLALLAGSVCTRFGVFAAGIASAEDPKYTVVPQQKGE